MSIGEFLDAKEVASRLGITVSAVHGLASRGTLSSEWLAGKRVWRRETIRRYLADLEAQKRRRPGGAQPVLFQGDEEIPLDRVVNQLMAQAPAGFDPVGRKRGHK